MKINFKKIMILVMGILFLLIYKFLNEHFGIAIYCPFYLLTGFYCPGCGITRLLFSILNGDLVKAFWYNPLVFITLIFFIIYKIISLKKTILIKEMSYYIYIVILIIYGVLRNLPFLVNTMPK